MSWGYVASFNISLCHVGARGILHQRIAPNLLLVQGLANTLEEVDRISYLQMFSALIGDSGC